MSPPGKHHVQRPPGAQRLAPLGEPGRVRVAEGCLLEAAGHRVWRGSVGERCCL